MTTAMCEAKSSDGYDTLSEEQQKVVTLVDSGKNVFFTGAAGTGKSYLLQSIVRRLRKKFGHKAIAVTATTAIASLNIKGVTIHSFAGIKLGKESKEKLADNICKNSGPKERWKETVTLVIDEISMLDGKLFDKLEYIARVIRRNSAPFGGIQLVLCGDFFQLPPVSEQNAPFFAFEADSWSKCISRPIFLHKVFRQRDKTFIEILTNMRRGTLTNNDVIKLSSLSRPLAYSDGIEPSQLFPLRRQVDSHNEMKLNGLPGPKFIYHAMDNAGYDDRGLPVLKNEAERLLDRLMSPPIITLKIGAQVMLIQNLEAGLLVNGSLGKVIGFTSISEATGKKLKIADFLEGKHDSNYSQAIPQDLRPLTNHIFGRRQLWPIVKFTNNEERVFTAAEFTIPNHLGTIQAHRIQVPLILAWAISIHKSQGQTLERVKIDLDNVFEKGQAYVAVSRATSMEGLEIQNFHTSRVFAHTNVIQWHNYWSSLGDDELSEDEVNT